MKEDLEMGEELMQHLRSRATELLLREEWNESVQAYSHFISLCQHHISHTHQRPDLDHLLRLQKSLCLALSNRAEAWSRLRDLANALQDCDGALEIEGTHFKTLLCKGKILLSLNRYSLALDCFKAALLDPQAGLKCEALNGFLERCKQLEHQSRTGVFDLSDWVVNGFRGKFPELAEYIGPVEIRKSDIRGRGLFATKNVDAGTSILATKAIATERCILPDQNEELADNIQLAMWKNFIDKVVESASKCKRLHHLLSVLSNGEDEDVLEVPDVNLFRAETEEESALSMGKLDMDKILSTLDVNSLVENAASAKVLGKNSDYYGVGLWILPAFINHSCSPNARRLHVGDHVIVHASRDIKAGEEITFAYFDVLSPWRKRTGMSKIWGFQCNCKRCKFEEQICSKMEMQEIQMGLERGLNMGDAVYRLEEGMRRWMVRGDEKGYLRASFWVAYSEAYESDHKTVRRWGRRIPAAEAVVDSVSKAVGSDERVLKAFLAGLQRRCGGGSGLVEMERAMKLARGVYGKVMKKQVMRTLVELGNHE